MIHDKPAGIVVDAFGFEIPDVIWCDTETGVAIVLARSPDGEIALNSAGTAPRELMLNRPRPLTLIVASDDQKEGT